MTLCKWGWCVSESPARGNGRGREHRAELVQVTTVTGRVLGAALVVGDDDEPRIVVEDVSDSRRPVLLDALSADAAAVLGAALRDGAHAGMGARMTAAQRLRGGGVRQRGPRPAAPLPAVSPDPPEATALRLVRTADEP